jgi:hypothetical protein
MELVYPHRLTLLNRGKCDVCDDKGGKLVRPNAGRYFGWETCNGEQCNKTIQNWYVQTRMTQEDLISRFGDWIYSERSVGKIESGWIITSDARQEVENGPYWVQIKFPRKHLTKEVMLKDLIEWNKDRK